MGTRYNISTLNIAITGDGSQLKRELVEQTVALNAFDDEVKSIRRGLGKQLAGGQVQIVTDSDLRNLETYASRMQLTERQAKSLADGFASLRSAGLANIKKSDLSSLQSIVAQSTTSIARHARRRRLVS